jgi:hypothetical protein
MQVKLCIKLIISCHRRELSVMHYYNNNQGFPRSSIINKIIDRLNIYYYRGNTRWYYQIKYRSYTQLYINLFCDTTKCFPDSNFWQILMPSSGVTFE